MGIEWEMPEKGWVRVDEARKQAVKEIVEKTKPAVEKAMRKGLVYKSSSAVERRVSASIREAIQRCTVEEQRFLEYLRLCRLIESAVSEARPEDIEPKSAQTKLEAYQGTASYIGNEVMVGLFNLGVEFYDAECKQMLREDIEESALATMLGDEWLAYHLGKAFWHLGNR